MPDETQQNSADPRRPKLSAWDRLGRALFRARGLTPIALLLIVILWPTGEGLSPPRLCVAVALMVAGETARLCAVGTAGKCTRTRGDNVAELVTSGPFARVRNPLYVGNFLLSYGLVALSRVGWLLWAFPVVFFFQYAAIVSWEEKILSARFGREYEEYRRSVPRWIPKPARVAAAAPHPFRADIAWRSERDTLRATAAIVAILLLKHFVFGGALTRFVLAAFRAGG